jgi:hypothetical protein
MAPCGRNRQQVGLAPREYLSQEGAKTEQICLDSRNPTDWPRGPPGLGV